MPEAAVAKKRILNLCRETNNDPLEIVGLMSVHALAAGNLAGVALWKIVADRLRARLCSAETALQQGRQVLDDLQEVVCTRQCEQHESEI